jgi:hypothetical protein
MKNGKFPKQNRAFKPGNTDEDILFLSADGGINFCIGRQIRILAGLVVLRNIPYHFFVRFDYIC